MSTGDIEEGDGIVLELDIEEEIDEDWDCWESDRFWPIDKEFEGNGDEEREEGEDEVDEDDGTREIEGEGVIEPTVAAADGERKLP